jgi:hypothetical protein
MPVAARLKRSSMSIQALHKTVLTLSVVGAMTLTIRAQKETPPSVTDILKAAGTYLQEYSQKLNAVGAEEEFLQMDIGGNRINHTQRVASDVVMVGLDKGQVVLFRDAYSIDTKAVHPRTDRLLKLFSEPPGPPIGPLQYAQRFTDESVSAYSSPNLHVLDSPFAAFELLRQSNQIRSEFKLDSVKANGDVRVALLKYKENGPESLLVSPSVPASGRLWIELPSGAIRQTEIIVSNKLLNLRASVTLAKDPGTGLWLPKEMSQNFDISEPGAGGVGTLNNRQSFETHIKYQKYQQVTIDLAKMR